jgi:hypothetical protein
VVAAVGALLQAEWQQQVSNIMLKSSQPEPAWAFCG